MLIIDVNEATAFGVGTIVGACVGCMVTTGLLYLLAKRYN